MCIRDSLQAGCTARFVSLPRCATCDSRRALGHRAAALAQAAMREARRDYLRAPGGDLILGWSGYG
eukprot:6991718-Pyramimonas_sp.AAC.1